MCPTSSPGLHSHPGGIESVPDYMEVMQMGLRWKSPAELFFWVHPVREEMGRGCNLTLSLSEGIGLLGDRQ